MRRQQTIQQGQRPSLRQSAQCATDRLREETEERTSAVAKRRLEREFGGVLRFNPRRQQSSQGGAPRGFNHSKKSSLLLSSRYVPGFSLPVVIRGTRRAGQGARCLGYKIEAIPRSMIERRLRTGTKIGPGSATKGARYAVGERSDYLIGDRTQLGDDGLALVLSNIDSNPEKCIEFFDVVERNERQPSPDQVTTNFSKSRWLWRKIVDHPECEPAVIAAYRADPNGSAVIDLRRGAEALRKVMRECDDRPITKPREQADRDREDGIEWRLGRGGRTQWRVVVNFPLEFSTAQRRVALQLICNHFAGMGCMYMGVIHEAAASNDWRNNHCHIDLYDRPCRRLTGDEDLDLANVSDRWIVDVRDRYRKGEFDGERDRWDFEVTRTVTYNSGNKRAQKVFRANKSKAMREYSMPKDSRREIAAIINGIAIRDLGRPAVDHRSYAEMGIPKRPDQPLGPRSNALEGKGIATETGMKNEQKHAEARRSEIELQYRQRSAKLTEWSEQFIRGTDQHWSTGARFKERDTAGAALLLERHLAEVTRDAALLQLEINRHLSSAYHVIRTSGRVIRKGEDKRGDHTMRRQVARDYWRAWVQDHADDVSLLGKMKALIRTMDSGSDIGVLVAAAIEPMPAPRTGKSEELCLSDEPVLPTLPILPGKRMSSLLQQREESDTLAKATPNLTLPTSIGTDSTTVRASAVSSVRRNIMRRVSPKTGPVMAGDQDGTKSVSPFKSETVSGSELDSSSWGPLDNSVWSGPAARPVEAVTGSGAIRRLSVQPEMAEAEAPLQRLEGLPPANHMISDNPVSKADHTDASSEDKILATNVRPGAGGSENPVGGELGELPNLESGADKGLSQGTARTVVGGTALAISQPMDVEKENLPACATLSASTDDGQPVVPERHFQALATPDLSKLCVANIEKEAGNIDSCLPDLVATVALKPEETAAIEAPQGAADQSVDEAEQAGGGKVQPTGAQRVLSYGGDGPPATTGGDADLREQPSKPIIAWDKLGLNEMDTLDEIERDQHQLVQVDGVVSFAQPDDVPEAHRLFLAVFLRPANRLFSEQSSRTRMIAWNELELNDMDTLDAIELDRRLLVQIDGKVSFAKPDEAPESHRSFLAAFQRPAKRLFVDQEARLKDGHAAAVLIEQGGGIS